LNVEETKALAGKTRAVAIRWQAPFYDNQLDDWALLAYESLSIAADALDELVADLEAVRAESASIQLALDAERYAHRKDNAFMIGERTRLRAALDKGIESLHRYSADPDDLGNDWRPLDVRLFLVGARDFLAAQETAT